VNKGFDRSQTFDRGQNGARSLTETFDRGQNGPRFLTKPLTTVKTSLTVAKHL